MPIYQYKCLECGDVSEFLILGSSDSKALACRSCGSQSLERLISAPSLLKNVTNSGATCCGRTERCETPPCSTGERCRRH